MKMINFPAMEKKWQNKWEKEKAFQVSEKSKKKKYYMLEMYPYPSGSGLHMGHAFNYTIGDIQARLRRMQGYNVLYPMGYDSFGLPAENAAIKAKSHPKKFTEKAIKNYIKQQKELGLSYDWSRVIMSHDPSFYKWDQWIFLKMLEKGLAYRKKAAVNFCKKCNTVLANEQVVQGKCWRHEDTEVKIKHLEQWFLRTTNYADELYENLSNMDGWPDRVRKLQKNWIGKSSGVEVDFLVQGKMWKVFTTRVDTLFGVTFLVVSAQHSNLMSLVSDSQKIEVEKFLKKIKSTSEEELVKLDKEGVFTGTYAIHPLTQEKIPIWTGNFVVADYGGGMVMAVPAHDSRDYEFAKKYGLQVKEVVKGDQKNSGVFTGYGMLVNSEGFNGLKSEEAKEHITNALMMKKLGRKKIAYRLRDWLISRQRFWGCPIPIIYCDKCGIVPVSEKSLPVKLPDNVKFTSKENPLKNHTPFVNVKCPTCKGKARRETDTMDTFVDSAWYFLRYCDPKNKNKIFDSKKVAYWMPIDQYIGGIEHATSHLIYFRFFTKFFRDIGVLDKKISEPAKKLFNQGILHGSNGQRMSKSKGNEILPETVSSKYGIDPARLFLVSMASPDKDFNWSDKGTEGSLRFILRVIDFVKDFKANKMSKLSESRLHRTIRDYTIDLEGFKYNLAVIKLRELFYTLESEGCDKKSIGDFLKLLSVICPHVAEELWSRLGNKKFISLSKWPEYEKRKINDKLEESERKVSKTVDDIKSILKIIKEKGKKANRVYVYVIPGEKKSYDAKKLSDKLGLEIVIFAVNDKKKHDPTNSSKKAKPGRPGIYVE